MNPFIPIMKRRGAGFLFDDTGPRVFARGLVEVTVDD
jgi:hypothetical protein